MNLFLKTKDYSVSGEEFDLMYDDQLDMLVTNPQPENLSKYYESEDYISHTDSNKTIVDILYQLVKKYALKSKLNLVTSLTNEKLLLDIGAGTGDFLAVAKNNGWKIVGVEPSETARKNAAKKDINLIEDKAALKNQKFDCITLWHVLEHLPNLTEQIQEIKKLLKKDGVLIVAVPNYKSYDAQFYKANWAAYDVPRHLWHFSRKSIQQLFSKEGMTVVKTKPMWFDSFYVSILSEKYKGNKLGAIKGMWRGLCSNFAALSTKEYSSVIYVIKIA